MSPTPHCRLLVRTLLALCAVSWLLSASAFEPGAPTPCEAAGAQRIRHRPIFCDRLTGLAFTFLNGNPGLLPARMAKVGEIGPGQVAKFQVFALTDDARFYANVTTETKATTIRIRPPRGGGSVGGTLQYVTPSNQPAYLFTPDRTTPEDRIAFFDVTYHCWGPKETYSSTFMLTIRGTNRAAPAGTPAGPSAPATATPQPGAPGCADVEVTIAPTTELFLYGETRDITIAVKNLGPEPLASAVTRIVFSNRLGVLAFDSPDDDGIAVREEERILVYTTGPLAVGQTSRLVVTVLAQTLGAAPIAAARVGTDCNPDNDTAGTALFVSLPPKSDLVGEWGPLAVIPPVAGQRPRRQQIEGTLTVRNVDYAPAPASRVAVFLSREAVPGPDDRLLGFGDVPAIADRSETLVALSFALAPSHSTRGGYVLAVIDSSNYARESNETNNLVLSTPLP
jgi:hypothetical protein